MTHTLPETFAILLQGFRVIPAPSQQPRIVESTLAAPGMRFQEPPAHLKGRVQIAAGFENRSEALPVERLIRIGLHGKAHLLALPDLPDVAFVHQAEDLHVREVFRDHEQRGPQRVALDEPRI